MKRTYEDHLKADQQQSNNEHHHHHHGSSSSSTTNSTIGTTTTTSNTISNSPNPNSTHHPHTILTPQQAYHHPTLNNNNPIIHQSNNNTFNRTNVVSTASTTAGVNNTQLPINSCSISQSINSKQPSSSTITTPAEPLNKKPKIINTTNNTNTNTTTNTPSIVNTSTPSINVAQSTNIPMNIPTMNMPSGIPNLSNLPPLSNFLFTTPPFLQAAAARNRSNSNTIYPNPTLTPNLFIPTPSNLIQSQRLRSNSSSNNIIPNIPNTLQNTLQNNLQNNLQNRLRSNSSSNNLPPFFLQQPPTNLGINSTPQKKPLNSISNNTPTNQSTNFTPLSHSNINTTTTTNHHSNPHITTTSGGGGGGGGTGITTSVSNAGSVGSVSGNSNFTNDQTRSQKLRETWSEIYKSLKKLETFVNDQFYVASNSKRTLKYEAYYLFKTIIFEHTKIQSRQIVLDKIDQDRKFYNSDNSHYISQRQLLKQTLQLFAEMDDQNIIIKNCNNMTTTTIGGGNNSNNTTTTTTSTINTSMDMIDQQSNINTINNNTIHSTKSEVYVDEFEKYAERETSEYYHKVANEWIEKYNLTEYLLFAEECIQQEQTRIQAIFPSNFSQIKLMKLCDIELLKNMEKRLLEMSGSGVKILIRDEKFDDLKRLYRLMNRLEGGLEPIADLFKQYLIFVGNELFTKYENATSEMIKSNNTINTINTTINNTINNTTNNTINNTINNTNQQQQQQHVISNEVYSKVVRYLIDSYVQDLLELHQKMKNIINGSFSRNVIFHKAMSEGFKQFVNKNISLGQFEIRIVQLFAYFTDDVLRRKSDEKKLDSIVDFIQFFSDRDMFIEEHRKLFAIRLLVTDYQELEERMMISKLKYHYRGVADTYKLEKMLTDKTMANDMKLEFQNYITTNQLHLPYDINVTVLTMGMWPLKAKENMLLAKEFLDSQHLFKQFYDSRNGKRVLKWVYSKSMAQIYAQYMNGNHLFELSTLQASILLLFNDNNQLSIKQIEDLTGLNYDGTINTINTINTTINTINTTSNTTNVDNTTSNNSNNSNTSNTSSKNIMQDLNSNSDIDLKQAITSLSSTKFPILHFKEMTLSLNENFSSRSYKLKIPLPRITQKDTQGTQTSVNTDRIHILDACVVRIMKTRKTMNIQSLFNEVASQLIPIFTPDIKQIKKRIESLIERDFLKRDESNNSIIHYVA